MLKVIRKLFIKDYENVRDERVRLSHALLGAWIGFITNLLLILAKGGVSLFLAYKAKWSLVPMALLADAVNNLSDLFSCLVLIIGFKAAGKPADEKHPFGHERAEYIAGLLLSILIILAAVQTFLGSVETLIDRQNISYDILTLFLLPFSILLKAFQGYCYYGIGKAIDSKTLKGSAWDSFVDILSSAAVLIGASLSYAIGFNALDSWLALLISFLILYAGVRLLLDSMDPILGLKNDPASYERIASEVQKKKPAVLGCHDILIHSYGPTKKYISLHIEVPENITLVQAHTLADSLEREIGKQEKAEVVIHVDPVDVDDPETQEILSSLENELRHIAPEASIHDLRLVHSQRETKVLLDVLLPFNLLEKEKTIERCLHKKLSQKEGKYRIFVHFDHPF